MDLGAILLLLALLLGVGLYLAAPLMNDHTKRVVQETQEVSSLMAERDRIINALQELDFDFKLGKIPLEDYPRQRAELLEMGGRILKKLDDIAPALSASEISSREGQTEESADNSKRITDDEIESMLASRRKERKSKSAGFCPQCGKPVLTTDLFCTHCGKALQ